MEAATLDLGWLCRKVEALPASKREETGTVRCRGFGERYSSLSIAVGRCSESFSSANCPRPSALWKLRYELLKFGLWPSPDGAGANIAKRAGGKSKFGDVITAC
jgi:hypothetical protein